jgi:hypothetical protein
VEEGKEAPNKTDKVLLRFKTSMDTTQMTLATQPLDKTIVGYGKKLQATYRCNNNQTKRTKERTSTEYLV